MSTFAKQMDSIAIDLINKIDLETLDPNFKSKTKQYFHLLTSINNFFINQKHSENYSKQFPKFNELYFRIITDIAENLNAKDG